MIRLKSYNFNSRKISIITDEGTLIFEQDDILNFLYMYYKYNKDERYQVKEIFEVLNFYVPVNSISKFSEIIYETLIINSVISYTTDFLDEYDLLQVVNFIKQNITFEDYKNIFLNNGTWYNAFVDYDHMFEYTIPNLVDEYNLAGF